MLYTVILWKLFKYLSFALLVLHFSTWNRAWPVCTCFGVLCSIRRISVDRPIGCSTCCSRHCCGNSWRTTVVLQMLSVWRRLSTDRTFLKIHFVYSFNQHKEHLKFCINLYFEKQKFSVHCDIFTTNKAEYHWYHLKLIISNNFHVIQQYGQKRNYEENHVLWISGCSCRIIASLLQNEIQEELCLCKNDQE